MMKYLMFFCTFLICLGCTKVDSKDTKRKIATEVSEYLIESDSVFNSSRAKAKLHITIKKLNQENYLVYSSFIHLESNDDNFETELKVFNGVNAIFYFNHDINFQLAKPFFVPDTKGWKFLVTYSGEDLYIEELIRVNYSKNDVFETVDELDF